MNYGEIDYEGQDDENVLDLLERDNWENDDDIADGYPIEDIDEVDDFNLNYGDIDYGGQDDEDFLEDLLERDNWWNDDDIAACWFFGFDWLFRDRLGSSRWNEGEPFKFQYLYIKMKIILKTQRGLEKKNFNGNPKLLQRGLKI